METVRDLIIIKFNFESLTCSQFYKYLLKPENSRSLCGIADSSKYLNNKNKLKSKNAKISDRKINEIWEKIILRQNFFQSTTVAVILTL